MQNNIKNNTLKLASTALLLLTAIIWGFAFVAQRQSTEHLGAFVFTGLRFSIGALSLIPVILIFDKEKLDRAKKKATLKYGIIVGVALFLASNVQQIGIEITQNVGKAGFITGLYTVIIPIAAFVIWKQRQGLNVWLGALLAAVGLFLVSVTDEFTVGVGDIVLLIGAFCWSAQMIMLEKAVDKVSPLKFSMVEFATCGILSMIFGFFLNGDTLTFDAISSSVWPLFVGGVLSVGVAYTLQTIAQKNVSASAAAIIFSTEALFGAISGALFLDEKMTARGYIGCAVIFAALIISQVDFTQLFKKERKTKENG